MSSEEQEQPSVDSVPTPVDTGLAGTQVPAPSSVVKVEPPPLEQLPLVRAIGGLASRNPRAFGPEGTSSLVHAAAEQLAYDLREAKSELKRTQQKLESVREELVTLRVDNATLQQKYANEVGTRQRRNLGIFIGTTLIGIGINLPKTVLAYGLMVLGTVLVVASWMPFAPGDGK